MNNVSYRGASTDHGGTIGEGLEHNVLVNVGGDLKYASVDGDLHNCPLEGHGLNYVNASGLMTIEGIKTTRLGDSCACGAIVTGCSESVFSD